MATQINPALARLWISNSTRQYGYRNFTQITNLQEDQLRVLDFLEQGLTVNQLGSLNQIAKVSLGRSDEILARISPVVWQCSETLSKRDVEQRFAEISRILLQGGDPVAILKQRLSKKIYLEKLDATGFTICKALDLAGIGKIISLDQRRIQLPDIGSLSFSKAQLGIPRVKAAQSLIGKKLEFHSRISKSLDEISVAVIISNDIVHPACYQRWLSRDIPHLAICFDEEGVEVSPLIIPGRTACLGCQELFRLQEIENWPVIAPQLLALERDLADSPMLLFASAVAMNNILNFVDFGEATTEAFRLNRSGEMVCYKPQNLSCGCRLAL
jgi:hypothetical protein